MTGESMSEVNGWFCVFADKQAYIFLSGKVPINLSYRACHGIQMVT